MYTLQLSHRPTKSPPSKTTGYYYETPSRPYTPPQTTSYIPPRTNRPATTPGFSPRPTSPPQ